MIRFVLIINKQGICRLSKWYIQIEKSEREKISKEILSRTLEKGGKSCNIIEQQGFKVVYEKYASLYVFMGCDLSENELYIHELIQFYVETLDCYYGNVCELDLIFNYQTTYYLLDEIILGGIHMECNTERICKEVQSISDMKT